VITPLLSVITSISYDHMAILGNTLAQIASEKAGILKLGVPAITIPQHPEAMEVIARTAADVGAPLFVAAERETRRQGDKETIKAVDLLVSQSPGLLVSFDPSERYHGPTETALKGIFQRENARLATGAALLLRDAGLPIDDAAIATGLATAQWPGRMELFPGLPPIVLDGAHNGDSARKLRESLAEAFPGRPVVFVLGVTQGHSAEHILAELVPYAHALVLTRARHPRAITDLDKLAALARPLLARPGGSAPLALAPTPHDALARARELAGDSALICVTGSLFVVAAAREALGIELVKD